MRSAILIDSLPDAVCVVDTAGNIKQSNKQFNKRFIWIPSGHDTSRTDDGINFIRNILHADHQKRFFTAMKMIRKGSYFDDEVRSVALNFSKTLVKGSHKSFPICRLVHWTLSSTDKDDSFILVGRDPDIVSIGADLPLCEKYDLPGNDCNASLATLSGANDAFRALTPKLDADAAAQVKALQNYFEKLPVAVHWLSTEGVILWANDLELNMVGYPAEEYIGHEIAEFLAPGEDKKLLEVLGKVLNGESATDVPFKFLTKNGGVNHLIANSNAKFGKNGSINHISDMNHHMKAEVLQAKTQLSKKHSESRTTFIRNVFHEIRTPMHVLSNFFSDSNPSRADFEDMRHHTDAILGIVDDLTFSTAFEAGEVSPLFPVPQHLPSVLAQVIDAVNTVEQKAGGTVAIKLHCEDVAADMEDVIADPFFKRVLFSLLSNAVKFSPLNGVVDVTVTHKSTGSAPIITTGESTVHTSGSSTPRQHPSMKHREPIILSLATICEKTVGTGEPEGYFTFHFRNRTVVPMNVSEVQHFFKRYYHSKSNMNVVGGGLASNSSYANLVDRSWDLKSEHSRTSSSPNFKDLNQYCGLGLGLYTAYNMVTLMGGTLECSVENDDEACFWFTIPSSFQDRDCAEVLTDRAADVSSEVCSERKCPEEDSCLSVETAVGPLNNLFLTTPPNTPIPSFAFLSQVSCPQTGTETYRKSTANTNIFQGFPESRVLVVDDSRICQKVAGRNLSDLEFILDYASNGLEAITKLAEKPLRYDAVLMDLRMPVMDGLEAIRKCRGCLGLTKLPIIALTAEVGASIKEEALRAGASWFLTKPAKAQELIIVLRALSYTK